MPDEIIDLGESAPTPPDADFWLEYGRKMVTDGPAAIRSAATSLMTGLGALRQHYETWLPLKQGQLQTAYWWMFGGLMAAIVLVVLRLKL